MEKQRQSFRWAFNTQHWNPRKNEFLFAFNCLQEEEKERVSRFVFRRDFKQALIGRLMLRKCVSQALCSPYKNVFFTRTEKGKPILEESLVQKVKGHFDFNVSHHGDFTVLAADFKQKVGVDVMRFENSRKTEKLSDFFKLMNRQFSDEEWKFIRNAESDSKMLFRFMRLWCLKESFVKAEGFGITRDLRTISFTCNSEELSDTFVTSDTQILVNGCVLNNWVFEESLIDCNHCVAVAYETDENDGSSEVNTQVFQQITFDKLMESAIELRSCDSSVWDSFSSKKESATA